MKKRILFSIFLLILSLVILLVIVNPVFNPGILYTVKILAQDKGAVLFILSTFFVALSFMWLVIDINDYLDQRRTNNGLGKKHGSNERAFGDA